MKYIALFLFAICFAIPAHADIALSGLPVGTTAVGTDQIPSVQSGPVDRLLSVNLIGGTIFANATSICTLSPATCGALFGFVLPQWYGGFCDSTWNNNNNFHDDSSAITTALASGYPVYIYHCKIASIVKYTGNSQMMFSFSQVVPYNTNGVAQPVPGAIFVPNNITSTAENCALSFDGYNNVGLWGINMHANFGASTGTAAICFDRAFRASTAFADVGYFHAGNFGMSIGSPTDSSGVPTASGGGDASCSFFGCNIQIQLQHFVLANSYFGMRGNWTDSHIDDGYITVQGVALSSFNNFGGTGSVNSVRIEDNFTGIPTGTSSIYPVAAQGLVSVGSGAVLDMTNIEFETNPHPSFEINGGNVQYFGGHMLNGTSAFNPVDTNIVMNGGSLLMSGVVTLVNGGHPIYGLVNSSATSQISIINGYPVNSAGGYAFGATASFNWLATPASLNFDLLGLDQQRIGGKAGVNIGTTSPLSTLTLGGNVSIGTSFSTSAAPTGGLSVVGKVGIGTANPLSPLGIVGLGTTAPLGTAAAGPLCSDGVNVYMKPAGTCP